MKENTVMMIVRKKLRESSNKLWDFKVHGSELQTKGVPDLVVVHYTGTKWIEVKSLETPKRPTTTAVNVKTFTGLQVETMRRIEAAGGEAFGLVKVGPFLYKMPVEALTLIGIRRIGYTVPELTANFPWYPWPISDAETFATWLLF